MAAIAGPILGSIAGAAASSLLSGGGPDIPNPAASLPTSLITPNFTLGPSTTTTTQRGRTFTRTNKKQLELTRTNDLLSQLGLLNEDQASALGGLIAQVQPGIGALTQARLSALNNNRRRTIGDIRDNLARRRVLGSSFAQDAISRANAEFSQQEAELRATSFLQELDLTNKLTQQKFDTLRSTVLAGIEQGNFEAQLAANFANRTQTVLGQVGQFQAQLAAQAQAGLGSFFQPAISAISSGVSNYVQSYFNPNTVTYPSGDTIAWSGPRAA